MDLSKYLALIQTAKLFFPRSDLLGDPYEGTYTRKMDLAGAEALAQAMQKQIYVSCWHMNDFESTAMWKLYSQSCDAVAVRSRYNLLARALPDDVYLGMVKYIDFENQSFPAGNIFGPYLYKRTSFSHETEARAVFWITPGMVKADPELDVPGVVGPPSREINVDLNALVEEVYVSPTAPEWFLRIVEDVTKKYGYSFPVRGSQIALKPVF